MTLTSTMTTTTPATPAAGANVRESSRYRRRAQEAERQAAQLQDELARTSAEAERQLAELQAQLARAEAERRRTMQQLADSQFDLRLQRHLMELGTSDLELAALAARKIMADEQLAANVADDAGDADNAANAGPDPRELARRVLREKPLLRAPNYQPSDSADENNSAGATNNAAGDDSAGATHKLVCGCADDAAEHENEGGMATLAAAMDNAAGDDSAGATHKLVCGCADASAPDESATAGRARRAVASSVASFQKPPALPGDETENSRTTTAETAGDAGNDDAASHAADTQENATDQTEAENAPSEISPGAPDNAEAAPRHLPTSADAPLPELGYGSRAPRTSPASHAPARRINRLAHQARCSGNRGDLAAYLRARRHS